MAEITGQSLKGIVASMMEKQAQQTRAAPTGLVGGLWEKATGEVKAYNEAIEENVKLKTEQQKRIIKMSRIQKQLDQINREVTQGLRDGKDAAKETAAEIKELTRDMDGLQKENEQAAESLNRSTQALREMNDGGGILKNGLSALIAKVGGSAAAFFSWSEALTSIDTRLRFATKSISDAAEATGDYSVSLDRVWEHSNRWDTAINQTTVSLAQMGIGAEDSRKIMESMSDGLRLTTENQGELITNTSQMSQDIGLMSKLLRVNTDDLANATVEASKRFGKSTGDMANDLAGLFDSFQEIKKGSKDTVVNFSDLTRATLEAQSSFQGYNFNLKSTANILGNVVAKAQEQGATYEMSMKAAQGLAGVITGGKAPDWAKYLAGKDMLKQVRQTVGKAKDLSEEGSEEIRGALVKQFKVNPKDLEGLSDIQLSLAKQFSLDPTSEAGKKQIEGLENLSKNYKKYGRLSSAKMTEELLRGTKQSNEAMFDMMKKQADKPEGREMLMRVWGLDEAAATAATLALHTAGSVEDFTKIEQEAKKGTAERKPTTMKDVREQTETFVKAMGSMEAGIVGSLKNILGALKQNPMISGAVGAAGAASTVGIQALQMGIGSSIAAALGKSKVFGALGNVLNRVTGGGAVAGAADLAGAVPTRTGLLSRLRGVTKRGPTVGQAARGVVSAATKAPGIALSGLTKAAQAAKGGLGSVAGGLVKMAGRAGPLAAVAAVGAAGFAAGTALRKLVPGLDGFAQGLFDSTAKLLGFKGTVSDAEAAQDALNNKSEGISKAIRQVTEGITTDYEKDSFKHMVAVRQLQGLREEDLEGYAKKVAESGQLTEDEAMERLRKLQAETVDNQKFMEARKEALGEDEPKQGKRRSTVGKAIAAAAPVVTELTDEQRAAVTGQVATQMAPEIREMAVPLFEQMASQSTEYHQALNESMTSHWTTTTDLATAFWRDQMPALAIDAWNRVGAAFEQRLGVPTSLPIAGGTAAGPAGQGAAGRADLATGTRLGNAVVGPDGTINLNVMIPRDALERSNTQSAGYAE